VHDTLQYLTGGWTAVERLGGWLDSRGRPDQLGSWRWLQGRLRGHGAIAGAAERVCCTCCLKPEGTISTS
jgi:hypothetical protein